MIIVQHQDSVGCGHYAEWLGEHHLVRPYEGEAVPDRIEDGLVVLGGSMNAYADTEAPWLPQVRKLMRQCLDEEVPVLGICLGAQLLSVAAGGGVQVAHPAGMELGITNIRLLPAAQRDDLLSGLPAQITGISAHSDGICPLPPQATLLAESARYPQAFRIGPCAWGLQFHPEVDAATFRQWAEEDISGLPDASPAKLAQIIAEAETHWGHMQQSARHIAARFNRIVTSFVRTL